MGILALIVLAIAIVAMVVVFFVKKSKEGKMKTKPSVEQKPIPEVQSYRCGSTILKVGDKVRIKGSPIEYTISHIYFIDNEDWYFTFEETKAMRSASDNWELVEPEKPKEESKVSIKQKFHYNDTIRRKDKSEDDQRIWYVLEVRYIDPVFDDSDFCYIVVPFTEESLVDEKDKMTIFSVNQDKWELVDINEEPKPKEEEEGVDGYDVLVPFKGIVDVKEGSKTDDYLYEIANEAYFQFFEGVSIHGLPSLFREENFPQIYNFYGEDGDEDSAFKTLAGWLLAMQLAELSPENRKTIYKIGYEMGGCNKDSKLYGWKFKCDPNICRLVAAAIYAAMRGICKPDIEAMREECGGISISDTIEEVRESDSFDLDHSYYVDLRAFMPTAAGPYAPNYKDRSQIGGYPYPNDAKMDDYNLAIDRAIRDMVVEKYNLDAPAQARTVQAIADKDANYNHLFGKRKQVEDYYFDPVFTKETLGQEVYPSLAKDLCSLVDDVLHIGSYQRCILQGNDSQENPPQYGRLRPGCSWQVEAHRHSDSDDTQNVLVDFYIEDNDGNPTGYYNADGEWVNKDGIHSPEEYNDVMKDELWANSYPSGHSAGIMSACLLLIELLPKQADKILAAANRFAVNRTIARYHWNSDTIQGRVLATCITPIIRCCSDWKERFKKAEECLKA